MNTQTTPEAFDYLIIGSGTAGATLARELSRGGQRVLILERGEHRPLQETVWGIVSILDEAGVADRLKDPRVFAAGGSTAMYLAVADTPPFEAFHALGIDLSREYESVQRELSLAALPDALLSPQTKRLRDAAVDLGYDWKKNTMLIDQAMCRGAYSYEAKWKALSFVDEAVRNGATLKCEARVERVLIENNEAIGVDCRLASSPFRARRARFYANKIIVAAGSLASPVILQKSGLSSVVSNGYFIDPSIAVIGRVPGLQGTNSFAGTMGATLDDGTRLLDANLHKFYFNMGMLQSLRPLRIASYAEHVAIMVKAQDAVGGRLSNDGRYHKELDPQVFDKLRHGVNVARRILIHAGATAIFKAPLMTGGAFGTLRIHDDVDAKLQTAIKNLYVCDGSLIPANARVAPTLTLICLANYLARILLDKAPVGATTPHRGEAVVL